MDLAPDGVSSTVRNFTPDVQRSGVRPTAPTQESQAGIRLVAVAGSAGAFAALGAILARLPADFPTPILYLQHLSESYAGNLESMLQSHTPMPVRWARPRSAGPTNFQAGNLYICPPGHTYTVATDGRVSVEPLDKADGILRSADRFFTSAAATMGRSLVGIVLSGCGFDGAEGVRAIRSAGGTVIVQDPASSVLPSMPQAAIGTGRADQVLPPQAIAPLLVSLARHGRSVLRHEHIARLRKHSQPANSMLREDTIRTILTAELDRASADFGHLHLLDSNSGNLQIAIQRGFDSEYVADFDHVAPDGRCPYAEALRAPGFVEFPDLMSDGRFIEQHEGFNATGIRSAYSVPLITSGKRCLGVLSLHFRKNRQWTAFKIDELKRRAVMAANLLLELGVVL